MNETTTEHDDKVFGVQDYTFVRLWRCVAQRVFPFMMEEVGELDEKTRLFITVCEAIVKPEAFDRFKWKGNGRPPSDYMAIFKAFLFKAVHDIPTTKDTISRLREEPRARRLCGWLHAADVPSPASFSNANKAFSEMGITDKWFGEFVKQYVGEVRQDTVSYDSAPIPVRARASNARRLLDELDPDQPSAPSRLEWQIEQDADTSLAELPKDCDWGAKRDAHGKPKHWKGCKIHAAVTSDGIPVAVTCTSASLHDSQAMIPLMKKATERIEHHFDLADAAYDAEPIRTACIEAGHVPIIDTNPRRSSDSTKTLSRKMTSLEKKVYADRGCDERFFSHLIDAHGGRHVRVRTPEKVAQHLMYGILVIAVEQTIRMLC